LPISAFFKGVLDFFSPFVFFSVFRALVNALYEDLVAVLWPDCSHRHLTDVLFFPSSCFLRFVPFSADGLSWPFRLVFISLTALRFFIALIFLHSRFLIRVIPRIPVPIARIAPFVPSGSYCSCPYLVVPVVTTC